MENTEQNLYDKTEDLSTNTETVNFVSKGYVKSEKPRQNPGPDSGILNSLGVWEYINNRFTQQN